MSTQTDNAVEIANAMVTASLVEDFDALRAVMPATGPEIAYVTIALSKLSARLLESLAAERDADTMEMWRGAMHANAVSKAL